MYYVFSSENGLCPRARWRVITIRHLIPTITIF